MAMSEADGGYTPTSAKRTIAPRRGLPSGRAVVGALLVTVAAVGAFAAAGRGDGGPRESYMVVARRVEAGTTVSAGDLGLVPMQLPAVAAANAVRSASAVEDAIAIHSLEAGDVLSVHDFVVAPAVGGEALGAIHELALPVPRERIPPRTAVGDRVTVLATVRLRDEPVTVLAAEDALVLGWASDGGTSGSGVLTLALEDAETAAGLAHLSVGGEITAVRTTRAVRDAYPDYAFDPALGEAAPGRAGAPTETQPGLPASGPPQLGGRGARP